MATPYFRQLPSLEYVSRLPDSKIGDYIQVKNLFRRGIIRSDIFQNLSFFEKYKINGDDRPDNVAFKVYGDPTLDWVILITNNITNIQSEWPLPQTSFDDYLRKKYGTGLDTEEKIYEKIYNGIHHYETVEVKNNSGVTVVPGGLEVPSNYGTGLSFYDANIQRQVPLSNITVPVTNYQFEDKIENDKRNIYVLKPRYVGVIVEDIENIMTYEKGSSQYVTGTLKRADNIKLYS